MSPEQEQRLTRIAPGTPMARLLREYWLPAVRSETLVPDGAPQRVRLFGENYAAFRVGDGTVGFFDEACPHRGASLVLARNENNSLRCIYHGWQFDSAGRVLEAPCEAGHPKYQSFIASVRARSWPVREGGGMVWVYLGARASPPEFPLFEFNRLPATHVHARRAVLNYNWLQGLEAHLDAAHLAVLHASTVGGGGSNDRDVDLALENAAPEMEMESTPYGMREAALRPLPQGILYARMRQIILPCFTLVPTAPGSCLSGRAIVPIDDEHTAEWYFIYHPGRPVAEDEIKRLWRNTAPDPEDFAANIGSAETAWMQDRDAMKRGHWTGLTRNVPFEDFSVSLSMGTRSSRGLEHLGPSDAVLGHARKALLDALEVFEKTGVAPWQENVDFARIRASTFRLQETRDWRAAAAAVA
jgi:phthalate 4,5-dioxygenase oxygenase subunit